MKMTNILINEECKNEIRLTLNKVAESIKNSLGPYGSTTIIQEPTGSFMTKDGFNIISKMRFNDTVMNTILSIINGISLEMVQKVGDGSTSCIIAADCLYNELEKFLSNNPTIRPKTILDSMNKIVSDLNHILMNDISKEISDDMSEIYNIASVSVNNDANIGKIIADIYKETKKHGFINIKLARGTETYVEKSKGFQLGFGYFDKSLVNTDTDECKVPNAKILAFNGSLLDETYLETITVAMNETSKNNEGLVIIAPGYGPSVSQYFRYMITNMRKTGHINKINIIKFPLGTELNVNLLEDLCIKTDTVLVNNKLGDIPEKEDIYGMLGSCEEVVSTYKLTSFYGAKGDAIDIKNRIGSIDAELQDIEDQGIKSAKSFELKKRKAIFENLLYTIYVGGNSEQAKITDKHLIEDAVAACKSAIKNGYVIGCNLSIVLAIDKLQQSILEDDSNYTKYDVLILNCIRDAIISVAMTVMENKYGKEAPMVDKIVTNCIYEQKCYNLINDTYTDKDIINSVETEIELLKNVTSIIGLLLTSNQFIAVNTEFEVK